jgi:hypothetical protein
VQALNSEEEEEEEEKEEELAPSTPNYKNKSEWVSSHT